LSPVFRHGSLRLYLLRLLDEEPRHGYEVIRLLRDRFMGVYSPSPGTIYPRLARLEEEGLVTHDEADGRKVYRITEAGREELRSRSDELDELEEELSASVSDIVREVREDVRQTVRSLREELTRAARESRRVGRDIGADLREQARQARDQAWEQARQARDQAREQARQARDQAREQERQARDQAREQDRQAREEARERSGATGWGRDDTLAAEAARRVHEHARRLREEAQRVREEAVARFAGGEHGGETPGWTDWPGRRGWDEWTRLRGRRGRPGPLDFGTFRDLEKLAVQFTSDLKKLAMQSTVVRENVIGDLRAILEEALERVKTEIFGTGPDTPRRAPGPAPGPAPGGAPGTAPGPAPGTADRAHDVPAPGAAPPPTGGPGDSRA
jgi:DNA-binding PadR family transcriptional regulator